MVMIKLNTESKVLSIKFRKLIMPSVSEDIVLLMECKHVTLWRAHGTTLAD